MFGILSSPMGIQPVNIRWTTKLRQNLITLGAITFPTKGLQIHFFRLSTLRHRNNVIDFQQKIRLHMGRVTASTAGVIVSGLDEFTKFLGHQRSLLLRKCTCSEFAFERFNQLNNRFLRHRHGKGSFRDPIDPDVWFQLLKKCTFRPYAELYKQPMI